MVSAAGDVRTVSRRLVRPVRLSSLDMVPSSEPQLEVVHLTPWDLSMITVDYIQKGILLPKPPSSSNFVDELASSFARTLARFYPLAGRLVAADIHNTGDEPAAGTTTSIAISLRCNSEGAEFVHAVAPGVTTRDITTPLHVPRVVWSFFPLNGVLGVDAVVDSRPVLAAQVTELDDGVFIAMSINHGVTDGTTFWHFMNTWSQINRSGVGDGSDEGLSLIKTPPPPALERWFVDTSCSVPIPLPFSQVEDMIRRTEFPPVQECFFHFSCESIKKLKAKANAEVAADTKPLAAAAITISSLQSLLAHVWRGVCRARRQSPDQETKYTLLVGCRARLKGIPQTYMGNAVTLAVAESSVGDVLDKGLSWTAFLLNRAVASFDEASIRDDLVAWHQNPRFVYSNTLGDSAKVMTGSSPRFDVYGNDFGWGGPLAVRSGAGNKVDGKVTVYEGRGGGGNMGLEVCLSPDVLARLVVDDEFMEAVSTA